MAVQGGPSNHPTPSVAQLPIVSRVLPVTAGTNQTVDLFADNLPGLSAWFLWDFGATAAPTVQLQFAFGQNSLTNTVNWQPLVPSYALVFGVPSLVNFRLGSRRYRAVVTAAAAGNVSYRLAAALT